jgi:dinuclear metal center YbgI/SA1388 family protein
MLARTIIDRFEEYCPLFLAEENDPVGLHVGTLNKEIKKVMVTLDVRPEVVKEAIFHHVDLLIAKHPLIFYPIKQLDIDDPQKKMYVDLLKHDIAVYVAHTNIDIVQPGLNDWFLEMLEVKNEGFLKKTHEINEVSYGIGRVGELSEALSLREFSEKVKKVFSLNSVRLVTKKPETLIKRVAVCGGSGDKFYPEAIQKGADVYITGDIYYHTGQEMIARNLHAIDSGHYIEVLFISRVAQLLSEWKHESGWNIEILTSKENTNPFIEY